jgi:hypothetical protein
MSRALEEFVWTESARIEGAIRYALAGLTCGCGCGEPIRLEDKQYRGRYYINGPHGTHGFLNLDEGQAPQIPDAPPELVR